MANELTLAINLSFIKANCQTVTRNLTKQVTVAGTYSTTSTQLIGTSDEVVVVSTDMGTIGFVLFENLDATNYIEIGNDGSNYPIRIKAGELAGPFRFNGTIHAKANTGACKLASTVIET